MPKKKSKIIDDSLKFYEFSQNNSGGSFTVTKDLCHRLFIEAKNEDEAIRILHYTTDFESLQ